MQFIVCFTGRNRNNTQCCGRKRKAFFMRPREVKRSQRRKIKVMVYILGSAVQKLKS